MTDRHVTLFLVSAAEDRDGTARAVLTTLASSQIAATAWIADIERDDRPPSPFAAVVAGEGPDVSAALSGFRPRKIRAAARMFKDLTVVNRRSRTPGVAMLSLLSPYRGVSREETVLRWREHAPLALAIHHAAQRYAQYELFDGMADEPPYAGMANLHFPDLDQMASGMFRTPDDIAVIAADVARFVYRHDTFLASEHIFGPD
jgi:hypothetical protein